MDLCGAISYEKSVVADMYVHQKCPFVLFATDKIDKIKILKFLQMSVTLVVNMVISYVTRSA